jgi:hypothetical protein
MVVTLYERNTFNGQEEHGEKPHPLQEMRKAFLPCQQESVLKLRLRQVGEGKELLLADRARDKKQEQIGTNRFLKSIHFKKKRHI